MTKMREAFEKYTAKAEVYSERLAFKAGYQAAIADVKEGGAMAWIEHHKGGDNLNWDQWHHPNNPATPLYKLPEDI